MSDNNEAAKEESENKEIEGYIHVDGVELPYISSEWVGCDACYWVHGHKVYTLEDGETIMDYDTDEGLQG